MLILTKIISPGKSYEVHGPNFFNRIIDLDKLKSFVLKVLSKYLPVMSHRYRYKKKIDSPGEP